MSHPLDYIIPGNKAPEYDFDRINSIGICDEIILECQLIPRFEKFRILSISISLLALSYFSYLILVNAICYFGFLATALTITAIVIVNPDHIAYLLPVLYSYAIKQIIQDWNYISYYDRKAELASRRKIKILNNQG